MTEDSFQEGRKFMQSANYVRGLITKAKGEVAKWTKIEDCYRQDLKEGQANGAKKCLDKALIRLQEQRKRFADMKFPESNFVKIQEVSKCEHCGARVAKGNTICGECACEDDGY